jgi:hypothetical protein
MQAVFTEALATVSRLFPSFGGYLLAGTPPQETEKKMDLLSAGMFILFEIVVAETARIECFLAAKFRIPQKVVQDAQKADWMQVRTDLAVALIEHVGKDWRLVK